MSTESTNPTTDTTADLPIRLEIDQGLAVLTFDKTGSSANIFDLPAINTLEQHLDTLEREAGLDGLILISAKPSIFIAGADIGSFDAHADESVIRDLVRRGQQMFHRIAKLPYPSVAAIHGACLGGGCELALACDYRIASPDRKTKIGLPETQLGILPAWGGCYRLPRLIGLINALNIILAGKAVAPKLARRYGLVDQLAPKEHLRRMAEEMLKRGKRKPTSHWKTNNPISARIIASKSENMTRAKTHGHYPAPHRALQVAVKSLRLAPDAAFKLEEDAMVELIRTPVSENLIRIFFLQERAKKQRINNISPERTVERIAVIGAGIMGAGIAQWNSARGNRVLLADINDEQVRKGMEAAGSIYAKATKRYIFTKTEAQRGLDRITPVSTAVPLHNMDMVIEAATERMDLKKKIFADLESRSAPETILATNTSALSVSEIADSLKHPERVVGIHYFNPVARMQLVELVLARQTDPQVAALALAFIQASGKLPVVVKDSPGFVVNRILLPYLLEAGNLVDEGVDPLTIDKAMLRFGMPMGPLRLIDEIGVDTAQHVASFFKETFPGRIDLPRCLTRLTEKDQLGCKSRLGVYAYPNGRRQGDLNPHVTEGAGSCHAGLDAKTLQERMVGLMINEATMCLQEEVVADPRDIDFAMIMGTGFAPFRGGPLRLADELGPDMLVRQLEKFAGLEPRFSPCDLLKDMAAGGQKFYRT